MLLNLRYKDLTGMNPLIRDGAGFRVYAPEDIELPPSSIKRGTLGLIIYVPEGYIGTVYTHPELVCYYGAYIAHPVHIDSKTYWDTQIPYVNIQHTPQLIEKGATVGQLIIQPYKQVQPQPVKTKIEGD